jgi:hypothetical protein
MFRQTLITMSVLCKLILGKDIRFVYSNEALTHLLREGHWRLLFKKLFLSKPSAFLFQ